MTHSEIEQALAVYRDLRGEERAEVDRHLAACAACAARLAAYRAMDRDLSGLRDARPANRVRQGFYAAITPTRETVPARPVRRSRLLAFGAPLAGILLLAVLVGAWAVWRGWLPGLDATAGRPFGTAIPTPRSALVGSFVWQTDGAFGYEVLRPAGWEGTDLGTSRSYLAPGSQNSTDGIELQAVNLKARFDRGSQTTNLVSGQWLAFEQNPTLAAWSAAMEQEWKNNGVTLVRLRTLPDATIYTYAMLEVYAPRRMLVAYKVQGGQPLGLVLIAGGAYAGLDRLEQDGLVDDFVTMVESARAIPSDPRNVVPPLAEGRATPSQLATPAATQAPQPAGTVSALGATSAITSTMSEGAGQADPPGWTRYSIRATGLSFAYPEGWGIFVPEGNPAPGATTVYQLIAPPADFPAGNTAEIVYLSYEIKPEQSLKDWVALYARAAGTPPQTALTQADAITEPGGQVHDYLRQTVNDQRGVTQSFFLRQGRLVILLQALTADQQAEAMGAALSKVLATFRFAPSAATTLNELYGTSRQWPTLDDYLPGVQPAATAATRCDVVCQDATAAVVLTLTPVAPATQSPSFRATEDAYNQRMLATQTREAQITPTPTATPTSTPAPRPAGAGLAVYEGASGYSAQWRFEVVYATSEWRQSPTRLEHQVLGGCSVAFGAMGRGMGGPMTQQAVPLGNNTWTVKTWTAEHLSTYDLAVGSKFFLVEITWSEGAGQDITDRCRQAGEAVLATFSVVD